MRICVFGAGAVGGHFAARLARGGAQVSVVARGAQLAAIRSRGLRVEAADATIVVPVAASDDPAALGPQDAVLVTLKAPALPALAAGIAPLLGPDTPVVFAMNGIPWWYFHAHPGPHAGRRLPRVDPGDAVWRAVGPERAIGGVVYSACTVVAPGIVRVGGARSRLELGEPDGVLTPRLAALAAAFRAGGLPIDETMRIRDRIWTKLLLNLSTGPLCVTTQSTLGQLYEEPACVAAMHRMLAEGGAIAAAMGCPVTDDIAALLAANRDSPHKPSILQDLEAGRPMEIAALYETPLDLARLCGVPTPTLDLAVALARSRARRAGLAG
jgi:2-dehydropantoate 2-reductase